MSASYSAEPKNGGAGITIATPARGAEFRQKLIVGAVSGIAGSTVIYPLDTVKTFIQSRNYSGGSQTLVSTTLRAIQEISSSGGIRAFYRGFGACLIGVAPEKALKLAVNDSSRDFLRSSDAKLSMSQEILASSAAGFVQLFITVPYEAVKIRLQLQGTVPLHQRIGLSSVLSSLGVSGIYRGFTAALLRDVPFCAIFFPLYANLKEAQKKYVWKSSGREEPFQLGLIAGIISGAVSSAAVTPADMIKTRMQQGLAGNMGFTAYTRSVVKTEGMKALYRGWHTRVATIAPLYGIVSLAFEIQKRLLKHAEE